MKRIFIICGLLTAFFLTYAGPVVFTGSTPESGSTITGWDFTLNFDITSALEDCADLDVNVGIGSYYSKASGMVTTLYRGNPENNDVIGTALTKTLNGKSDSFKVNGNTISFSFDETLPIVDGQLYTIVITNRFAMYKEGSTSMVNATILKCVDDPIVLTFIGGSTGKSQVALKESIPANNSSCDELSEIVLKFEDIVALTDDSRFEVLKDGNDFISVPLTQIEDDGKTIIIKFDSPVYFDESHTYTCKIPENSITHGSDKTVRNPEFSFTVIGIHTYTYKMIDKSLTLDAIKNPAEVSITFDLPDGKSVTPPSSYTGGVFHTMYLYKVTENGETEVTNFNGIGQSDGKTIKWTIENNASCSWNPGCNYILRFSPFRNIFGESGKYSLESKLEEVSFEFSTTSIEDADLPKIELNSTPKLGAFNDAGIPEFKNGGSYASIGNLEIQKTPYLYNGQSLNPTCVDGAKAYIYEVTNGERTLIKDAIIGGISYEEKYDYVYGIQIWVNTTFYSGHKYEIVIPTGSLEIASVPSIRNYTTNEEIVYTLNGATAKEIKLESCSVKEGETLSELAACVWVFDGTLSLKQGATGTLSTRSAGSSVTSIGTQPLFAAIEGGKTYITMSLADRSGKIKVFDDDSLERWLTLPAGVIFIPGDEETSNEEITVNFKGTSKYVTLSVETEGLHAHSSKAVKGEVSEVRLTPDSFWEVSELTLNGEDVTANLNDGVYTTPILTENTSIKAKLAYNGSLVFADTTTGVAQLPETNVKIYSDGDTIVVEGVATGDEVVLYSISGMVIGRHVANQDTIRITIGHGQYIVRVGNNAANILH